LVSVPCAAPATITATATSTTQVNVSWSAIPCADHYELFRKSAGTTYSLRGSPTTNSFTDLSVVAGATYVYEVRSVSASGAPSSFSPSEAATTIVFSDDPIVAGM